MTLKQNITINFPSPSTGPWPSLRYFTFVHKTFFIPEFPSFSAPLSFSNASLTKYPSPCVVLHALKTIWITNHHRCFAGRSCFRELCLLIESTPQHALHTYGSVYIKRKTVLGSEPLEAAGLMWDSGKSCIFSHQKWWSYIFVKTKFPSDRVPRLACVLHYNPPLISVFPVLPCSGLCSSMTPLWWQTWEISLHLPFPSPLHHTVCRSGWRKEKEDAYLQSCFQWKDPSTSCFIWCGERPWTKSLLSCCPPPKQDWNPQAGWREESWISVTSAVVTLASCPHMSCWTLCFFSFSLLHLSLDWTWHPSLGTSMISWLNWGGWNGATDYFWWPLVRFRKLESSTGESACHVLQSCSRLWSTQDRLLVFITSWSVWPCTYTHLIRQTKFI